MSTYHPEVGNFAGHLATVGRAVDDWLTSDMPDALASDIDWQTALSGPVPQRGIGADATIEEYVRLIVAHGQRLTSATSWGWITTGPTTVPSVVAAGTMAAAPQRQLVSAFHQVEELSLEWLAEICGLAPHMRGIYSSGGSTANLVALGAARQYALERAGYDASDLGLDGRRLAVYTSTQAHHTVQRAAGVLGIGRSTVRAIPVDAHRRMDLGALASALDRDTRAGIMPVAVVASAGTTNTGAIDPLRGAGDLAHAHGAWFHVDGAYGLPGILDDRVAALYDGLELADSAITDPHKWLGAPVGVAATFVRDRAILHRAFTQEPADYLEGAFSADDVQSSLDSMGIPYFDFGVELSAPPRGVMVWAILREIGVDGLRARIVADNDFARQVAARAHAHPRLEVLAEPVLSICGFRYRTDADRDWDSVNSRILRRFARETSIVVSSTFVDGNYVLRPCFINARTTPKHVDDFIEAVVAFGDELSA
ncbi:MAG TPA: aminotransferase class V-fold PLP-dependent enzyme [Candidatus Limnocylindrales bacterium]|nr:aminotransferase class V-fold PLP-dependent enzyme [Candidatus Limnocylindrales bacterium]